MFLVYTSSRSLIIQFDRRLLIFHSHRKLLVIKATKLQEISTFHNSKNGLPRGPPLVYTKERSLDPNHTIFKNSVPKYTYSQNISHFCDLACSTFCMALHGFLVDSLLMQWRITLTSSIGCPFPTLKWFILCPIFPFKFSVITERLDLEQYEDPCPEIQAVNSSRFLCWAMTEKPENLT